ncbi:hypothetical protein HYDPIDRAFT_32710 [Hydnomerulius pinastri MD-312]|uniref:DUF6699 domain-containing protein n=1 Tax=Hydnomerulius pinastri MD-312 TaxID=994086 RepID=A0A0C9V3Q4_9AGAM|nr:hypothetical protein HYDPIDRAFT_32710 [Hydnomerulius pinastri MD-312]
MRFGVDPVRAMRYWRDREMENGHRDLDPEYVRDALRDICRNYNVDDVPGCGADPGTPVFPDEHAPAFWNHTPLTPVFPRSRARSACECPTPHTPARAIFGTPSPRHHPYHCRRRGPTHPERRNSNHFPNTINNGIQVDADPSQRPWWGQLNTPHNNGFFNLPTASPNGWFPGGGGGGAPGGWTWTPNFAGLPPRQPDHQSWNYPGGTITWTPHPQPHPNIPAPQFWSPNPLLGGQRTWPNQALDPWGVARMTGGHPLPGTAPQWSPGTWPPLNWPNDVPLRLSPYLIPNPINANLAQIDWDVSKNPSTARRLTGAHINADLSAIWSHAATYPDVKKVLVLIDGGYMSTLWGPIVIDQTGKVTIRDLFEAIHEYFNTPLNRVEVDYITSLGRNNYNTLVDAYRQRCRGSSSLPGWEAQQGFRRVDCLGDRKHWWGVWISPSPDGTWCLNLGLINPAHRQPRP